MADSNIDDLKQCTLLFFSPTLMENLRFKVSPSTLARTFRIDLNKSFLDVLKEGLPKSKEKVILEEWSFLIPSSRRNHRFVLEAIQQDSDDETFFHKLNFLLEGRGETTLSFLERLKKMASYLLSTLNEEDPQVPVLVRKREDITFGTVRTEIIPECYPSLLIQCKKASDFHKDDIKTNLIFDVDADPEAEGIQLHLADQILKSALPVINKAEVHAAVEGPLFSLRDPVLWKKIEDAAGEGQLQIIDDPSLIGKGDLLEGFVDSIAAAHLAFRRVDELVWERKTSSAIKGRMVQTLIFDALDDGKDYIVTENQSARSTFILQYLGDKSCHSSFTPVPDTLARYKAFIYAFCEIISNSSETDRFRIILEGSRQNQFKRAKGLVDGTTRETLTIALYMDARMVVTVYFLTTQDDINSNKIPAYYKKIDYYLAGREVDVLDDAGEPTGKKKHSPSEWLPFLIFLWNVRHFYDKMKAGQQDLLEEISREVHTASVLLTRAKDMVAASKVDSELVQAARHPELVSSGHTAVVLKTSKSYRKSRSGSNKDDDAYEPPRTKGKGTGSVPSKPSAVRKSERKRAATIRESEEPSEAEPEGTS